ncbi:MAG: CDP-diacylglycerol--glycerol-3-phosphate 3-phosphatidyltransferase [Actinomycetes bacterium]
MNPAQPGPEAARAEPSSVNLPNALTVARLILVPLFLWLLLRDGGADPASRIWAAVVFLIASATDFIDGDLARRYGQVTNFGKIADPIADKALTGAALIGLSYLGDLAWWITLVIVVREVGVTLLRLWVIRLGVIPASRGGKVKTVAQMLAIVLYLLPLPDSVSLIRVLVLGIALALTVVTGIDYVVRVVKLRASADASQESP